MKEFDEEFDEELDEATEIAIDILTEKFSYILVHYIDSVGAENLMDGWTDDVIISITSNNPFLNWLFDKNKGDETFD